MSKVSILLFLIIIAVFGGIFYLTQKDSLKKSVLSASQVPSLPPDASTLQVISRLSQAQQQQAQNQVPANQQAAQNQQPASAVEMGPPKASMSAMIRTTKGTITLSLVLKDAPNAINNFITKAKSGYYDGLTFHRVEDWVIQGGDPTGTGNGGNPIQTELNQKPFTAGAVGLAASSKSARARASPMTRSSSSPNKMPTGSTASIQTSRQ